MNIQCPSCRFERDVPDSALRPGKTYKVTCPRCSAIFQFSCPDEEFVFEAEEEPAAPSVESAPVSVQNRSEEQAAEPPLARPAAEEGVDKPASEDSSPAPAPEKQEQEEVHSEDAAVVPDAERKEDEQESLDPEEEMPSDGRPAGAPWESPEYYGFLGSFSRTLLGVLFHAPEFFRHVKCQFSVIRPILFYVLLSLFQMLCARLWSIKALREMSATATDPQTLAMAEQLMQSMNMPLMLLITPFFSVLQAVMLAGFYHLMIRMVQPERADFATTLRVVCYSAAPLILCIVPMFGSAVATMWSVVTVFVGCRFALKLSWIRTVLALLPLYILELAFITQIPALMGM